MQTINSKVRHFGLRPITFKAFRHLGFRSRGTVMSKSVPKSRIDEVNENQSGEIGNKYSSNYVMFQASL